MTWYCLEGTQPVISTVEQPQLESRTRSGAADPAGDWLCASCLNGVANERDRFQVGGQDEFSFANPAGFRFEIILFRDTRGCRETGVPTVEYTWFPGHAWSFCQCAQCGQHLGWYYSGPQQFAGLIRERIVRALYIRN